MALLPNTFSKTEQIGAWIDPPPMTLVMAATSQTKTDEVVTALIHCVEGMKIKSRRSAKRTVRRGPGVTGSHATRARISPPRSSWAVSIQPSPPGIGWERLTSFSFER